MVQLEGELHDLAAARLRQEPAGHTLQPTALVNEVFIRMAAQDRGQIANRSQFLALSATTIRRILVDHARKRDAAKRPGRDQRLTLSGVDPGGPEIAYDLIELDETLCQLAQVDGDLARIVEMRVFGGLTIDEVADALGVTPSTVNRRWAVAKSWLARSLEQRNG